MTQGKREAHDRVLEAAERQADRQRIRGEGLGVALARSGRDEDHRRRRSVLRRPAEYHQIGPYTFFAGSRSDAFFFDFDEIKNLFDTRGKRNFTEPHLGGKSPWTGVDSNTEANVFSTVIELPTSELDPKPEIHIWGRCSVRRDGKLLHVDRAGHPSVSSFFNTDDTKEEYNASEPPGFRSEAQRA